MTERVTLPEGTGSRLRAWRMGRELSLQKAANVLGTSKTTYGRLENGSREVPRQLGERITAVLEEKDTGIEDGTLQQADAALEPDIYKLRKEVAMLRKLVALQNSLIQIYEDEREGMRRRRKDMAQKGEDMLSFPEGIE